MNSELANQDTVSSSKNMTIALIDLECTCDDIEIFGPHEIIEIGAILGTLYQDKFNVIDELQIYVKPVINPLLTNFCTQLTGITQSTVDTSIILEEALLVLENWLQTNDVIAWLSWGKFDSNQFARECTLKSHKNPLADIPHLNAKQLFARKFGHRIGLERAINLRGLEFVGRLHSGLDDAKNIAALLAQEVLLREAVLKRISAPFNHDKIRPIVQKLS